MKEEIIVSLFSQLVCVAGGVVGGEREKARINVCILSMLGFSDQPQKLM